MKAYRIKDGFVHIWESFKDGEDFFIREIKYKKLPEVEDKEITIDDFAERLIRGLHGD